MNAFQALPIEEMSDQAYLLRMEQRIKELEGMVDGQEAAFAVRVFTSVFDSFLGVFNNFKAVATSPFTSAIRSELKAYVESNRLKVKQVHGLQYTDVANIDMPIPRGMKTSYVDMVSIIYESMKKLDMINRMKIASESIKRIHDAIAANKGIDSEVQQAFTSFDPKTKAAIAVRMRKVQDTKDAFIKEPFSKVFASMGDFTSASEDLLMLTQLYHDTQHVHKYLERIEEYVENIIEMLTDNNDANITKQNIKDLGNITHLYASVFDMYGQVMICFHRVDHNFVECYKTLMKAKKI